MWIATGAAVILLIPFIAMRFTPEVHWDVFDFMVAGILLLGGGLLGDLVIRKTRRGKRRILFLIILTVIFILTWAELAVGLFGTPFGGH